MKIIKPSVFLFFIIFSFPASAQLIKRANKYYDQYDYIKSIRLYERVLRKGDDMEALEKISNALRLTRNYEMAETYYARLVTHPEIKPITHYYYGMVLKNNNKIDSARDQFSIYFASFPGDKQAENNVRSCDDVKLWIKKVQQFDVAPVQYINTSHSEFCPVVFKDKLYFTSDRTKDIMNNMVYSWNKQPFLNEYYVNILDKKEGLYSIADKTVLVKWPINSPYHDGPLCFNSEENQVYLTRVNYEEHKEDRTFVNRPKLYTSIAKGDKWGDMQPFQYNSDKYSVAHPSLSADGQWLFFTSDMPGGMGGTDIWMCHKTGEVWGAPENLGDQVNTPADEMFPYIAKDGTLYFSSEGHSGFGGLDIFSAEKADGKFINVANIGAPINSSTDDFGIIFTDENTHGYFSSDRKSGKGADDIYSFIALQKFISISGKLLQSQDINDPLKGVGVRLFTMDGKLVKTSFTDSTGNFNFQHLDPSIQYMVKLDEENPDLKGKEKIYMADKFNNILRVAVVNENGEKFVFAHLPLDNTELPLLPAEDVVNFAGNLLYGEDGKPLANTKVNLLNGKGEVIASTTTNYRGAFVFRELPADKNFLVKVDETDTELPYNTKISITNKQGKEIQSTKTGKKGSFDFSFIASDKATLQAMEVEDRELKFDFKGRFVSSTKAPLINSIIHLVNAKGEILETATTDRNGSFRFEKLPSDKSVLFTVEETDTRLAMYDKLYITDEKGNILKEFVRKKNGKFDFEILPSDIKKLGSMYVEDVQLAQLKTKLPPPPPAKPKAREEEDNSDTQLIYYAYNKFTLDEASAIKLDAIISELKTNPEWWVELMSYTDSRGSQKYNYALSRRRTYACTTYLMKHGISKSQVSGECYGEQFLINKCVDGVACPEELHAQNRRTEIKVYKK